VRDIAGHELALPSWEHATGEDWLGKWAMNLMLLNVSTRKFRRAVRLPEGDVTAPAGFGVPKSAASRHFVPLGKAVAVVIFVFMALCSPMKLRNWKLTCQSSPRCKRALRVPQPDSSQMLREALPVDKLVELRQTVEEKRAEFRAAIEALVQETNQPFISWAPELPDELVSNCRVLPSRYHLLDRMPKAGVCVEVGTQKGDFAKHIVEATKPRRFHIIDCDLSVFDRSFFDAQIKSQKCYLHEGDSSTILRDFPNHYFDWIYIDADHAYESFMRDLEVSAHKVREHGFIVCNDYTVWSPQEVFGYGILRGLHEFCIRNRWEFVYIGLHGQGYHDVCIRQLGQRQWRRRRLWPWSRAVA
jgi:hypothetical protein